jgi:hypothetical protein
VSSRLLEASELGAPVECHGEDERDSKDEHEGTPASAVGSMHATPGTGAKTLRG